MTPARDPRRWGFGRWSLARRMLVLQVVVVVLIVGIGAAVSLIEARRDASTDGRDETMAVAETLAHLPVVDAALLGSDPSKVLQPEAENVRKSTGVSFIVFMSPAGIRYSHPTASLIGKHYIGDISHAQHGTPYTETYQGTLGVSVRTIVPIEQNGRLLGMVSVGVLVGQIGAIASQRLPDLLAFAALALALGVIASLLLERRLRRQTLGLEPAEITRQYQHHHAVLHAVTDGMVITDPSGRLVMANDEARRLLHLPDGPEGRPVAELVEAELAERLADPETAIDEQYALDGRMLLISRSTAEVDGRVIGVVATLRDRTELRAALRELDTTRALVDVLRAQAHESAGRMRALAGEIVRPRPAPAAGTDLPKGLSAATYDLVVGALRAADQPRSASELARDTGLSRVSARRYLDHLCRQGLVALSPRYGTTGRPEHLYQWVGPESEASSSPRSTL